MNNHFQYITINSIPYVKEIRTIAGSVTATILWQQLDYWFSKNPDGFYKFLEPCTLTLYKKGCSWVEEVGFSSNEFRNAFSKIGIAYKSKKEFDSSSNIFLKNNKTYYFCSYYDRIKNLTFYYRNHKLVDDTLNAIISSTKTVNNENEFTEIDVNSDPIPKCSDLVKKGNDTLSLPSLGTVEIVDNKAGKTGTTSKKRTSKKVKTKKSTSSSDTAKTTRSDTKTSSNNKKPKTLKAWKEKILETDDGIHECVRDVTRWLAQKYGDNKRYHEQIIKAFQNSKRAKREPSRFGHDFFRTFDELFEGALCWVQDIKIQNYYSNFFKDVIVPNLLLGKSTDTKKINSKFIDLPTKDINEKWVCVIDSDLGTGKTEWIKNHINQYKGKSIVYISPRIALAMAAAIRLGMDDYQVVKNLISGKFNLSVCINSLLKKVSSDDKIDILILDEIDQTIKQLLSNTISSKDR
jgi:hypothetical protein